MKTTQTSLHHARGGAGATETASVAHPAVLVPVMGIVLVGFLVIGLALPVLPLHVHQDLGLSSFVVGLVTGSQFATSVVTRVWSGRYADARGAKRTVIAGLIAAALAGLIYLLSLGLREAPQLSASVLLLGRALLGGAESFIITGAVTWGLALVGPQRAGQVIAWMGMAMFAAMALGAPLGTILYGYGGFAAVALATMIVPLIGAIPVWFLPAVSAQGGKRASLATVVSAVWLPGLGAALASLGFGAILAFSALLYDAKGWSPVWLGFSSYACALVAARAFLGHLPDKLGGAKVALVSTIVEAIGLALMWWATSGTVAAIGAALTGLGYALVYPALGAEAVRRTPAASRGLAMGAYTVCLDIALGIGSPVLGAIAGATGFGTVFLVCALLVLAAVAVEISLLVRRPT